MTPTTRTVPLAGLYETDEVAWLDAMVELLDLGAHEGLDYANLRECLHDMGASQRREVSNRLIVLLMHILKWEFQPGMRSESWRRTIYAQQRLLKLDTKGGVLRTHALEVFSECYEEAVADAAKETRLPAETFPPACPYTLERALAFDPPPVASDGRAGTAADAEEGDEE